MKKGISLPLALSFITVSGIVGLTVGYYFSPVYQANMYEKVEMGLGVADRYLDLRYLDAMATHHQSAIMLAQQVVTTSKRSEIRDLATTIINSEPSSIDQLMQWKKSWYNDSRSYSAPQIVNLGTYDDKLDLRFLNALISHHKLGINMAKEALSKSTNNEILNNANELIEFLTNSHLILQDWRFNWYGVK
ncbi:MAG: DUF305 domain-containing protein [bacterium]